MTPTPGDHADRNAALLAERYDLTAIEAERCLTPDQVRRANTATQLRRARQLLAATDDPATLQARRATLHRDKPTRRRNP